MRKGQVGGETPASIKCFKCRVAGDRANECKSSEKRCFKSGEIGHLIANCKSSSLNCFKCGEPSQVSTRY